jgi:arylsulfatase A-like enzyme
MNDGRSFLAAWGAQFFVLWLAISGVFFLFYVTMPRTAWNDPLFSPADRSGLAGLELLLLAGLALGASLLVSTLGVALRRSRSAAVPEAVGKGAVFAALWLVGSVYIASWLTFRSTGIFLDPTGFALFQANAGQMIQHVAHMDPVLLVLLPAAATLFAAVVAILPVRVEQRLREGRTRRVVIAAGGLALLSGLTALRGDAAALEHVYRRAGPQRTGPAIHVAAQIARQMKGRSDPIARAPLPATQPRPIIPMSAYLASADPGASQRWNVIVLVIESLRPDQLISFGGERSVMPAVDALAEEARRFSYNYTQASHSDYADVAILSSHYPLRSAGYHIYPENPTYPRVLLYDVLKALDYRVGIFSSQNEEWGGMKNYLETGSVDRFLHAGSYEGDTYVPRADEGFYRFVRGSKRAGKIDDRFTVGEAVEWIDESTKPFFVYMNLQNSHVPYEVPVDFEPVFGSGYVTFPISFGHFPRDSVAAVKNMYANSLAYVDAQVARLTEHLRETGEWERTLLVITGDTGQAFFEHGFAAHANALFDEVMRVPLIVRAPGLEPGADARLSQHIDVPPTVLGLLGLPPHASFQGMDLLGPTEARSAFLVGQAIAHQYAIVQGSHKLIYDARLGSHLLFDLVDDLGETDDLSASSPELVCRLGLRLHSWRRAQLEYYGDPRAHSAEYPPVLDPAFPARGDPETCEAMAE